LKLQNRCTREHSDINKCWTTEPQKLLKCRRKGTRKSQHSWACQKPTPALFFVPHDLDLFTPNKWVPGLMVEHFYVKFGDCSCIGFFHISCGETDRQTPVKTLPPQLRRRG